MKSNKYKTEIPVQKSENNAVVEVPDKQHAELLIHS